MDNKRPRSTSPGRPAAIARPAALLLAIAALAPACDTSGMGGLGALGERPLVGGTGGTMDVEVPQMTQTRPPTHPLQGSWFIKSGSCGGALIFGEQGRFAVVEACELADGTIGVDAREGRYTVSGSQVTGHLTAFSCPRRTASSSSATVAIAGNTLTVGDGSGGEQWQRGDLVLRGSEVKHGCLIGDEKFSFTGAESDLGIAVARAR